ncbi:MAG: FtsW/RodA/SpoVE family cell cycle protein [Prevotellaceae bacterium]|nr:FtsW/RodA/SpoVE family cell cycle protein [Prevotellaceae bacterium]
MTLLNNKQTLKQLFSLQGDRTLWAIFFFLSAISLIEVYSAASSLISTRGVYSVMSAHFKYQLIGFICVWLFHNIPCRYFKSLTPAWLIIVLMLAYLLMFGEKVNDGARWINLFGLRFQPSEFAKGLLVLIVAFILSTYQTKKSTDRHAFKYIMIFASVTCLLILPENFSTAFILFSVIVAMMFFGRVPMKQLGKLFGVLALFGVVAYGTVKILPMDKITKAVPSLHRLDNFVSRIDRFTESKEDEFKNSKDSIIRNYHFDINKEPQVGHANIAIAKSNVLGCGPGNSKERDFLYQAYSDFIFAIIIEELGLVGGAGVILLYIILLFRASRIANRCERNFPAFLVLGLAILIVAQAAVNMSVAVGLIPVTGQPLPLISRGGSSIIATSIYFGMMLSVSRFAKKRQPATNTEKTETTPQTTTNIVNEQEFQSDSGIE